MSAAPRGGPIRVFIGGTFDGLHLGHIHLFGFARRRGLAMARRLRRTGVHVSVVIARDTSVRRIKHRAPLHTQSERRRLVASLRAVDAAFVGAPKNFVQSVRRVQPDLIVLGYDQGASWERILLEAGIRARIVRCPAYKGQKLKSSRLRADWSGMPT